MIECHYPLTYFVHVVLIVIQFHLFPLTLPRVYTCSLGFFRLYLCFCYSFPFYVCLEIIVCEYLLLLSTLSTTACNGNGKCNVHQQSQPMHY